MLVNGTKRSAILTSSTATDGLFVSRTTAVADEELFETSTVGDFDGTDGDTSSFGGSDFGESSIGKSAFGKSFFFF